MRILVLMIAVQFNLAFGEVLDDIVGTEQHPTLLIELEFLNHPVELDSPYILVGDVAHCKMSEDICRPYLAYLIALTPELGKTANYSNSQVLECLAKGFPQDKFHLAGQGIQVSAAKETAKEDDKAAVTKLIQDEIAGLNKELLNLNQRINLEKITLNSPWTFRKSARTFKLQNLTLETLKLKQITLRVEYKEEFEKQIFHIPVQYSLELLLPVAMSSLTGNHVLEDKDFELTWIKANQTLLNTKNFISNPAELSGKAVRGYIQAGQPIARQMLIEPVVIKRGQMVTLLLQSGEIILRAKAQAVDQGSIGQTIEVTNSLSKKRLRARVVDHESVMAL